MKIGFPRLLAFLVLVSVAAPAQMTRARQRSGGGTRSPRGSYSATAFFDPPPAVLPLPVLGAPYSGTESTESSQTLADGTHVSQGGLRQRIYRDGQGRMRIEHPIGPPLNRTSRSVEVDPIVEITDPVAGVLYVLDMQNRVAHRSFARTPPERPRGAIPPQRLSPALPPGAESLGTQTIDGVAVEGVRTTRIIPAGSAGSDRDLVTTTETWTSPELGIIVLRKSSDPRTGERTFRILNLSRADQEYSLFLPPAGFLIKDESGPFSITYSMP